MQGLSQAQLKNPLKILILNSEYPPIGGGAGTAAANLAKYMVSQGQDVHVLTARFGNLPARENNNGFLLIRIPAMRKRADRSSPWEQVCFIFSSMIYCLLHFEQWKPDVCWAFFGFPSGMTALFIKWVYKIPYIVSLRGGDVPGFRPYDFKTYHQLGSPFIKHVWKQSFSVVANSEGLKELALKFYGRVPISIIPNGVDLDYFKPCERDWSSSHLLFIGRVVYQKGLDLLVRALSHLKKLSWDLSIVGDGSYKEQLLSQIDDNQLSDRVHILGWRSKEELLSNLAHANIFINPSRHEGMPNAVLEAMACGLPIIASRIAGNEDLVRHGENGLMINSENEDELKDALQILITEKDLCQRMGAFSRKMVEQQFSWSHSGEQYLDLLRRSLEMN